MDNNLRCTNIVESMDSLICDSTFEYCYLDRPVVVFYVKLYRRSFLTTGYYKAEISFANLYHDNPEFANKGFTKEGLRLLINFLNKHSLCSYIILNIDKNNDVSRSVAKANKFSELEDEVFYFFLDNALDIFKKSVNGLGLENEKDEIDRFTEKYTMFLNNFTRI